MMGKLGKFSELFGSMKLGVYCHNEEKDFHHFIFKENFTYKKVGVEKDGF